MRPCLFLLLCGGLLVAQTPAQAPLTGRERALLERIDRLEQRIAALEAKAGLSVETAAAVGTPLAAVEPVKPAEAAQGGAILGMSGTTLNFYFDGYYGHNFNRPVGRTTQLRSNDTIASNFTLNQIGLILERAPDVAAGRRYGGRVDLMFGQNTESMMGNPANEPRPNVYRNVFQAYGTYVFPAGSGLTVDFGKFYSSFGLENNYTYDELNYSRSWLYTFLPYYHMGFRTTYNVNDRVSAQYWLVNGINQTEDFNGFKSNAFLLTIKPSKSVSWNAGYYIGRDNREQPGSPAPNGRTHIADTYVSWNISNRVTAAAQFDYGIARIQSKSAPSYLLGGAGYLKYQLTPKWSVAGRFEHLRDQGGLFSSLAQTLNEGTLTATYQPEDGVQMRLEFRRDASDRPYFLTSTPGLLKKSQATATLGMIWWFGGKKDSW